MTSVTEHAPTATQPTQRAAEAVLLPLRLFLAAGWLRAGAEKMIDTSWWTGDSLRGFLIEQDAAMLPFFRPVSQAILEPLAVPVSWVVAEAQIAIGLCLLLGRWPRRALWAGVALNVCFVMAGRVNPSAFYLVMQLALLIALSRPVDLTIAWRRAGVWLAGAALVVPFARTLAPAEVIDDPALMLAFTSGLAAVSTIAWSAAHTRFPLGWIDLLPRSTWSDRVRRGLQNFTTPSS